MNDEDRDKEIRRLLSEIKVADIDRRLVTLSKQLDCEWDECPEKFHRFMLLSHPESHEPFAISMCMQEKGKQPVELIFSLGDAFDIALALMTFLGTISDE